MESFGPYTFSYSPYCTVYYAYWWVYSVKAMVTLNVCLFKEILVYLNKNNFTKILCVLSSDLFPNQPTHAMRKQDDKPLSNNDYVNDQT